MHKFYYCSEEIFRADLPVYCDLIRYLSVGSTEGKAAVIKTEHPIHNIQESNFVVLAKGTDIIPDVFENKLVGVYLLPLDERAGFDTLDLTAGLQPVQDWGGLTTSRETAEEWQIKA